MSYYVYNKESSKIAKGKKNRNYLDHEYATLAAAKAAVTRMDKKWLAKEFYEEGIDSPNRPIFKYAIAEAAYYHEHIEKFEVTYSMYDKERKNPIRQSVNTPAYMDPGCESYWSM
jgi:general stress protein 26